MDIERKVRLACRDSFRESNILHDIIPFSEVLCRRADLGHEEAVQCNSCKGGLGDAGHRS